MYHPNRRSRCHGRRCSARFLKRALLSTHLVFPLTIDSSCYMLGYVTLFGPSKSFPSYHIAPTPAVTRIKPPKSFRIRTYEEHRGGGGMAEDRGTEKIRRATMNAAKYSCFCRIAPQPKGSSPRSSTTQFTGSFNGTKPIWRPGRGATLGSAAPTSIGGAGAAK